MKCQISFSITSVRFQAVLLYALDRTSTSPRQTRLPNERGAVRRKAKPLSLIMGFYGFFGVTVGDGNGFTIGDSVGLVAGLVVGLAWAVAV